jgi:hypothetical protein
MLDLVCERCGLSWHSAASADVANERGGCLDCGGTLRGLGEQHPDRRPLAALRVAEQATSGRDDDWAA